MKKLHDYGSYHQAMNEQPKPRRRQGWTTQEVARLRDLAATLPVKTVALQMGRSVRSISSAAQVRHISLKRGIVTYPG